MESIEGVLKDKEYDQKLMQQWVDSICASCLLRLSKLEKPFKYVVNCFIMQKNGAGVNYANSLYCDNVTDGISQVQWPLEKSHSNKKGNLQCVVSVYGLSFC